MAIISEIDQAKFDEWLEGRPEIIQKLAAKCPPGRLYLLKTSNHRVFPYSYSEDGTITVVVSGDYSAVMFERRVFGINPDDLVECDLPDDNEVLGTMLTEEEDVKEYCSILRKAHNQGN
jgi:hypothetical protein